MSRDTPSVTFSVFNPPGGSAWDFIARGGRIRRILADGSNDSASTRVWFDTPGACNYCTGHEGETQTEATAKALACCLLGGGGLYPPSLHDDFSYDSIGTPENNTRMGQWRVMMCEAVERTYIDGVTMDFWSTPQLLPFDRFTLLGEEGEYFDHVVEFCYKLCRHTLHTSLYHEQVLFATEQGQAFRNRYQKCMELNHSNKRRRVDVEEGEIAEESKQT